MTFQSTALLTIEYGFNYWLFKYSGSPGTKFLCLIKAPTVIHTTKMHIFPTHCLHLFTYSELPHLSTCVLNTTERSDIMGWDISVLAPGPAGTVMIDEKGGIDGIARRARERR